jgi:hypothetical protein
VRAVKDDDDDDDDDDDMKEFDYFLCDYWSPLMDA